jgi:O-succinylbenzoate synthase
MIIERIDLYHTRLPFRTPYVISSQYITDIQPLLVKVYAEGLVGWGEAPTDPDPGYCYETWKTAWHISTEFLIPNLLGKDLQEPEDLGGWMSHVRGHPFAKSMFDMAAWDLTAQRDGLSLAQKLAQPYPEGPRARVTAGGAIGIQSSISETLDKIREKRERGFDRIKLKIKPGHDLELARAARAAFPDVPLMLDANSSFRLDDAPVFQAMDDLDLLMLEQPMGHDDFYEHCRLKPQIKTPLCLDESIKSSGDARLALFIDACDIINIKPGRVGGWVEARLILDLCREKGIPVWIGGMGESGIGGAAQIALASLPGVVLPSDVAGVSDHHTVRLTAPPTLNPDSTVTVPTGPGLGIDIYEEQVESVTLREETFKLGQA